MTTKAQERKALEQIRKIVEGLGEGSYLSMAFEGCFEMAESNIDNDFGNSPKEAITTLREKYEEAKAEADDKREAYNLLNERYNEERNNHKSEIEAKDFRIAGIISDRDDWMRSYNEAATERAELSNKVSELEQQVLELKAKLYDYMVNEAH